MPSLKDHFGTFSVARSPRKWNPSFTMYQKTRVPEVPENQKHQSRNPQINFEGIKVGFSKFWLHQHTRLSLAHLFPGSEFQNLKFEKLGFPHKTLSCSCSCSLRTTCSCSCNTCCSCSRRTSCNHPWSYLKSWQWLPLLPDGATTCKCYQRYVLTYV